MEKKLIIALILTLSVLSLLLLTERITPTHREYEPDSLPTQPKADKQAQPVKEITLKMQ
jgi:hypothetical protein